MPSLIRAARAFCLSCSEEWEGANALPRAGVHTRDTGHSTGYVMTIAGVVEPKAGVVPQPTHIDRPVDGSVDGIVALLGDLGVPKHYGRRRVAGVVRDELGRSFNSNTLQRAVNIYRAQSDG